ncbi:Bystin [Ancylostoma ceylanicum]|uniref:Bystin n=1 Tax=Ancylostoma ceylanicum TaxID=53326 RepID=A0A0D6LPJ5_9BILA|nr:Bystin [Ancylostoma ceylanicum]
MGKKSAIQKSAKGDLIPTPGPLDQQIEGASIAKARSAEREKRKRKSEQKSDEYIPNTLSEKIILEAKKQLYDIDKEDGTAEVENNKRMRHVSLGGTSEGDSDADEFPDDDGYDDQALDPKDEADLERFMVNKESGAKTLYDIIRAKIDAKTDDAELALSTVDPNEFNIRDLDPEVVEMYKEIGKVLSKYRSGKIPKAFKVIPKMSGTCTLREATIFSSVLAKVSIPMFHAAAAMLKIAELEYNGANSVFLRALIDKKFALPYKAIDAIVSHFLRMKNDERDMPVLWHQCLLAVCQRYKNDLSQEQKAAIIDLTRYQSHYLISPEVRRELESKEGESSRTSVAKVEVVARQNDSMEF